MGRVGHPEKEAQHRLAMGRYTERAMSIHPTIRFRVAPGRVAIQASQPFGNNALGFLLLVPDWATRFDHHLVGAHHPTSRALPQERLEK